MEITIQQLAKAAGTTSRTLRHYDSVGLVSPSRIGSNGYRYYDDRSRPVDSYQTSDGCRLAESQIRLPDGRTDTRYVRTCPDQYGRYRVVD